MNIDKLFSEDEIRSQIASRGNLVRLEKTYSKIQKVQNPNTSSFWDKKLMPQNNFIMDPMTEDRIKHAVGLVPHRAKKILDLGVGQGYFIKKFKAKSHLAEIFGIDISLGGLKKIKATIPGYYFVASILSPPFKETFDLITIFEVLEHIPYYQTFKVLAQIKKLLKKNGVLLASVPINESYTSKNNPNGHLRRYSKELFIAELKLAGFRLISVKEFYAFKNFYNFKKLLSKLFPHRWKPNLILIKASLNL